MRAEPAPQVRPQEGERATDELEGQEPDADAEHASHEAATCDLAGWRPLDLAVRGVLGHAVALTS